jgi:hypothetical protein
MPSIDLFWLDWKTQTCRSRHSRDCCDAIGTEKIQAFRLNDTDRF